MIINKSNAILGRNIDGKARKRVIILENLPGTRELNNWHSTNSFVQLREIWGLVLYLYLFGLASLETLFSGENPRYVLTTLHFLLIQLTK